MRHASRNSTETPESRREFLATLGRGGAMVAACGCVDFALGAEPRPLSERPAAEPHSLVEIQGSPLERGRAYGKRFAAEIREFLDREIYAPFAREQPRRDELLRYADACLKPIRRLSPEVAAEMEGMAEGSGLRLAEHVLITLHEELYHQGVLPPLEHCTALAVGPPDTRDGNSYVAQSWDWMPSVYGKSQMLLWRRSDGPSVLAYSYPGLWMGAGLNSAGVSLCWTSAADNSIPGPGAGVPSYALIAHLLAQPDLDTAVEEAKRAEKAGWYTFVMGDGQGRIANIEGSPKKVAVEWGRGHCARVYYGSREMTGTPEGQPVRYHPQCRRMYELVAAAKSKIDLAAVQGFYGDHESTICKHFGTLDAMVFDCTQRAAWITRGPGCLAAWQRFAFPPA